MKDNILNRIRSIVSLIMQKSSLLLRLLIKFAAFFLLFKTISGFDYFTQSGLFNSTSIQLILAAAATFLPNRTGILIGLCIIVYNIYLTSVVGAIIVGLMLLLLYVITANLFPEYTYLLALVPVCIHFHIYLAVPLFAGLFIGAASLVPVVMGVLMYGVVQIIPAFLNLQMDGSLDEIPKLIADASSSGVSSIAGNDELKALIILSAAVLLLISLLKLLRFSYSRYVAIGVSSLFGILYMFLGISRGQIHSPAGTALLWSVLTIAALVFLEFMKVSANYKEARDLEFEDEDYIYQVHMIPKNAIFGSRQTVLTKEEAEVKDVTKPKKNAAPESEAAPAAAAASVPVRKQAPQGQPRRRKPAQTEVVRPSEAQIRDAEEKALKAAEEERIAMEGDTIRSEKIDVPLPSVVPMEFEQTRKVEDTAAAEAPVEKAPAPRSVLSEDEPQDVFEEFGGKNH